MGVTASRTTLSTKLISIIVSIAMVLAFVPSAGLPQIAQAADSTVTISTAAELQALATAVNGGTTYEGMTVQLGADIDLSGVANWTPIGDATHAFAGTFDGQGKAIKGLTITSGDEYVGLFGNNAGTVENLSVAGQIGTEDAPVGTATDASATSAKDNYGSVVAYNTGTVQRVDSSVTLYAKGYAIGGIVGRNVGGTVYQCSNAGVVNASICGYRVGGIVGHLSTGTVEQCSDSANVIGNNYKNGCQGVGGIVGSVDASGTVKDCFCSASIVTDGATWTDTNGGKQGCGGIVGAFNGGDAYNCYSLVKDTYAPASSGIIIGKLGSGTYQNLYYQDGATAHSGSATYTSADENADGSLVIGGAGLAKMYNVPTSYTNNWVKSASYLKSADFVTALNADRETAVWAADATSINGGYPILAWQVPAPAAYDVTLTASAESVHADETYDITVAMTYEEAINGAQVNLSYDPAVATVDHITFGDKVVAAQTAGTTNPDSSFDNEAGTAIISTYGDASFDASEGMVFATVTFKSVKFTTDEEKTASVVCTDAVATVTLSAEDIELSYDETPTTVTVESAYVFTVYTQKAYSTTSEVAAKFTQPELDAMAPAEQTAIAGQYFKGGSMGVWASTKYVTLTTLFDQANVSWTQGCKAIWGGDASQGKAVNTFTYDELSNGSFFPNVSIDKSTGEFDYDTTDSEATPAAIALTAGRAFVSTSETGSTTGAEAKAAALVAEAAGADAGSMPTMIIGWDEETVAAGDCYGKPYWNTLDSITVVSPAMSVYSQEYGSSETTFVAGFTMEDLEEMAGDGQTPIAGQYLKSGSLGVWASSEYVTFETLFDRAGLTWKSGCRAIWGGDASQGKAANDYTYDELDAGYFFPNSSIDKETGKYVYSEADSVSTPAAIALTAGRAFASIAEKDSETAAEAKEAALAAEEAGDNAGDTPLVIIGNTVENAEDGNMAGKPYWRNTDSITMVTAPTFEVVTDSYVTGYSLVKYTGEVEEGMVPYMQKQAMCKLPNGDFVSITKDPSKLTNASFSQKAEAETLIARAGDVNLNTRVNIVDAQITLDIANGVYTDFTVTTKRMWLEADVNDDNKVDAVDARAIQAVVHGETAA